MARRHRRRHFRGYVSLPGLGNIPFLPTGSVKSTDVVIGGAAGWAVSKVVEAVAAKYLPSVFGMLGKFTPLATGAATAVAANYSKKFIGSSRAEGLAVGALTVGAAMTAANFLRGVAIPVIGGTFSEVAMVNLGRYGGLLVNDNTNAYNGLLINDNTNDMAAMAGLSMGDDDDGMYDLVNVPGAGG